MSQVEYNMNPLSHPHGGFPLHGRDTLSSATLLATQDSSLSPRPEHLILVSPSRDASTARLRRSPAQIGLYFAGYFEFIVRACNSHQKLVDACNKTVDEIDCVNECHGGCEKMGDVLAARCCYCEAKAALAEAEKE